MRDNHWRVKCEPVARLTQIIVSRWILDRFEQNHVQRAQLISSYE